jgi:hypothetical protein
VWSGIWDIEVGAATHHGLDSPVFELLWGLHFLHPSIAAPRPDQPPVQWVLRLFTKSKVAGTWCCWPTSVADDKERMELYLYLSPYLHGILQDELYLYLTLSWNERIPIAIWIVYSCFSGVAVSRNRLLLQCDFMMVWHVILFNIIIP